MNKKVLIVEDEEVLTRLFSEAFGLEGIDTIIAKDGLEAFTLATTVIPDFILLDIMLPEMDGIAVFKKLLADPRTKNIPVALSSALDRDISHFVGEDAKVVENAVAYWQKSMYDPKEIVDYVKKRIYSNS